AALIKSTSSIRARARSKLANKLNDVYFNEASSECTYLAAGSAIEVTRRVANGEFNSAVAII
ncbi:histone deacetylase 5, partial [Trifolium medium]|nr:histone deacetylase 5 [Trifolium medium]